MNAQEIIEDALSEIRAKRTGHTVPAEDIQLGLRKLNRMIGHWSGADNLVVPYRTREELSLSSGANAYTIGSGGDLNTTRPVSIHLAKLKSGTTEYEMWPISLERLARYTDKSVTGRPEFFLYEPVSPLGRLYFEKTVDQTYTLILWSLKPLTGFATLTTDDSFAEEYDELLVSNLAVRLAPDFGKRASEDTRTMARDTLMAVKASNEASRVPTLSVDRALLQGQYFDFEGGEL